MFGKILLKHIHIEIVYRNQQTRIVRIVLHSTSAPIQAKIALQRSDKNIRKIILATNIAESSITVPDVKYGIYN